MAAHDHDFFVPQNSIWPPLSCFGIGILFFGFVMLLHPADFGVAPIVPKLMMGSGALLAAFGIFKWFAKIVGESRERGFKQVPLVIELANKYGIIFFILSEVMFFAAFFAAWFYLSGANSVWPPANIETLAIHLPVINTLLLLSSGATVTWAHHAMLEGNRKEASIALFMTWHLGIIFLFAQMYEYSHAAFGMSSGVYGSLFYMLTGFHGFHVLLGTVMLMVAHYRLTKGDWTPKHHFYFEAAAWYWHFVDVVWIGLFLFVYVLA
jgi:cytochrome c oxidase subunit 3